MPLEEPSSFVRLLNTLRERWMDWLWIGIIQSGKGIAIRPLYRLANKEDKNVLL